MDESGRKNDATGEERSGVSEDRADESGEAGSAVADAEVEADEEAAAEAAAASFPFCVACCDFLLAFAAVLAVMTVAWWVWGLMN